MHVKHWGRLATCGAAGIFALGAGLGLGTPAQAAAVSHAAAHAAPHPATQVSLGVSDCPLQYACFWVNANYTGTMGEVEGNNPDYLNLKNTSGCTAFPGTWNDCISSVWNNGKDCTVYFWTDANYEGRYHSLALKDGVANVGTGYNDPSFNDSISSNSWCTPKPTS